jgi:hypothetical protein
MIFVADSGIRVDLERVVVDGRVLEEAVVWVEHLLGEKVEPLTSNSAVVETDFSIEFDPKFCLEDIDLNKVGRI